MASEKQVMANRANAKRSTGPKTETGKALSRVNACRHGLTAETIVIGDEDPKKFGILRAELEEEYNPRPGIESELVERLAVLMWRMRRIPMFEAALIELNREQVASQKRIDSMITDPFKDEERKETPHENTAVAFQNSQQTLGTLFRYEAALMNAFNRTLQQLLFLQDRRACDEDESQVVEILTSTSNGRDAASQ
jgi:hypothetical protein